MKLIYPIIVLGIMLNHSVSQAQDWPALQHFAAANEKLSPPLDGENRVVFMGNSITIGWLQAMPAFFENNPYINRGISGQTTPQMLLRFRQDVIELNPSVVVILAGTNDIAGNTGPATLKMIMDNLVSMTELARANGIKVVLSSVLPASEFSWTEGKNPKERIPALNRMIHTYAKSQDIVYLDYFKALANSNNGMDPSLAADGVHPTLRAYEIMAPLAKAAIKKALESN